jgi:uncharacterized membrane protein YccC
VPDPVVAAAGAGRSPGEILGSINWTAWVPKWSKASALRAVRATVVVPGLFAFCDKVVGNLQMATFAAFGGFATLVLANFAGTRRDKTIAHVTLAVIGSALVAIGTAVNASTVAAALVTLVVTFLVFFAGVAGPNAASGVTAALLAYVLPAASPGAVSMIPERLAGWWMASVAGTAAVLLLSPRPPGDALRSTTSATARAIANELRGALRRGATPSDAAAMLDAKHKLLGAFSATPFRPTGLATADQGLANVVELLEWCSSLVLDCVNECTTLLLADPPERDLLLASAAMLDDVARLLDGEDVRPAVDELERLRQGSSQHLAGLDANSDEYVTAVKLAFHAETISLAARGAAADALIACRRADPETIAVQRRRWYGGLAEAEPAPQRLGGMRGIATIVARQTSLRSVWFLNSVRGSVALAAAVAVADLSSVQHGFWVVLGTMSVLRTNAASTGSTALRALLGTVVGFVIGALLISLIGTGETALWTALPITVLIASYAPGAAPFEVGQAAFTVLVSVLFNLIAPVGSQIGVVRIEDVAIGCAVSAVVGVLFWPRGAAAVVGNDLADAFRRGADYLRQAVDWVLDNRSTAPDGGVAAVTAGMRVDDALRAFLAEQGSKRVSKQELWRLVGASLRLRLTANSLSALGVSDRDHVPARAELTAAVRDLAGWYERVAAQVGRPSHNADVSALDAPTIPEVGGMDTATENRCVSILWVHEHLQHLVQHAPVLIEPALRVAELRRIPWWR